MLNCYDDYVEIYVGCGRYLIGKYCIDGLSGMFFDVYFFDYCLQIKFYFNSFGVGKGFEVEYLLFF